jgi:hypothetical protein
VTCRAGAGGLGAGADRHGDSERTWVECDSGVGELCSVTSLVVSYVLRGLWMLVGGLTEEVRKVRIALAFLPLISIMVSIQCNIHYIREG